MVNIKSLPLGQLEIVIEIKSSVKTGVAYTEVLQVQIVDCLNDEDITVSNPVNHGSTMFRFGIPLSNPTLDLTPETYSFDGTPFC